MWRVLIVWSMVGCQSGAGAPADLATSDAATATNPTAKIAATPDVVGFVTRLDGTGSTDPLQRALGYAWHFAQVPSGSALTDAAFSTATGPTPTFDPDVGGVYQIQLTVTAPDSSNNLAVASVTVPTLPIYYYEGVFPSSGPESFAVGVVRSDGSGAHRISCAVSSTGPGDLGGDDLFDLLELPGLLALRVWDGATSRVAFEQVTPTIAGNQRTLAHALFVADEQSDCASKPPVRLDDGTLPDQSKLGPRFSPDGGRVAYLENARLTTIAVDGSARHVVRSGKLIAAPPVWIDATHVGWVEDLSPTPSPHPAFKSAADSDGAGDSAATTLVDCAPTGDNLQVINQWERLSDGSIVVAGGVKSKTMSGSINLYKLAASSCSTGAATLLVTSGAAGDAWDFTVAPDGNTIALSSSVVQVSAPAPQHDVYFIKVDGSAAPALFSGSDALLDDVGPRWLADGRQLMWTQAARPDDAGQTHGAGVQIANLNGSHLRSLKPEVVGAQGRTAAVGGSNRGLACDYSDGDSTALPLVFLIVLIAVRIRWRGGAAA